MKVETCFVCKKKESADDKIKQWEMKHLHFAEGTLKRLTCDECKSIHPYKLLDLIKAESTKTEAAE